MAATAPPLTMPQAFLADILDRPDDDAPRLIYADWLDEQGDHDRAEFIRVQCRIAVLEARRPLGADLAGLGAGLDGLTGLAALRRREEYLSRAYGWRWMGTAFNELLGKVRGGGPGPVFASRGCPEVVEFRRGFVEAVTLPCAAWCGGPCEACQGRGINTDSLSPGWRDDCSRCRGACRVGALGPALVRAAPLKEVWLSDKEPYPSGPGRRAWFHPDVPGGDGRASIPEPIFSLLAEYDNRGAGPSRVRWYEERGPALDALSTACLAWARLPEDKR